MAKFIKAILKLFAVFLVLVVLLMLATGMNPFAKSGFANCVIAESVSAFTGKYLKHSGNAERETVKTELCAVKDLELDNNDGPKKGRVRWVECSRGPDCDEAGMI